MRTHAWFAAALMAAFCAVLCADDLPYVETFETRADGYFHNQDRWLAVPEEYSQVQSAVVYAGEKAGVVGKNSMLRRTFPGAGETNVWIDLYARFQPRAYDLAPIPADDAVASFYFNSSGKIVAYSNTTWVTLNSYTMPANAWRRFTVNLDYIGSNWAIYVAGSVPNELSAPVATNLAFAAGVTNKVFTQFRVKN